MVVKGLERNISCLYEARRLLLLLDSCETAEVTEMAPEPAAAGGGLASYWLNMLLQQLRLSEQGEHAHARVSLWVCTQLSWKRKRATSATQSFKGNDVHFCQLFV